MPARPMLCERDGCGKPGYPYYLQNGTVHAGWVQVATQKSRNGEGWIVLCHDHALADLGVAV